MVVRFIDGQESQQLYELLKEMGYSPDEESLPAMVEKLNRSDKDYIVGAYIDDKLKGWLHAAIMDRVTSGIYVEIVGLAVAEDSKREGVGMALIKSLQTWTTSNGIGKIRVRCSTHRKGAHAFYEELGFELSKKQKIYDLKIFDD